MMRTTEADLARLDEKNDYPIFGSHITLRALWETLVSYRNPKLDVFDSTPPMEVYAIDYTVRTVVSQCLVHARCGAHSMVVRGRASGTDGFYRF
jgi:hypothetical protein